MRIPQRSLLGERTRFVLACTAAALGLTVILPAANLPIWVVTLLVTEWGHWLVAAPLLLLFWELARGRGFYRPVTSVVCVIAAGLFLLPVIEAVPIGDQLPKNLAQAFGPRPASAGVPERPLQFIRLWSSRKPSGIVLKELHFTTTDGTSLPLDFYSDGEPGARPCLIIVHGGAWHTGNEKELESWNPLLAQPGYRVASIGYRLAPRYRWPAQEEDLTAALAFLKAHAGELGVDAQQFAFLGRSAGAQIILATAYSLHDPSVRGCIGCYTPADMRFDYETKNHSILPAQRIITAFLGAPPDGAPELYRTASPLELIGPDTPPTLLTHGTRDELVWVENSRQLRDRLIAAHRPAYLLELPWATHGFDLNPKGPGGQLEFYAITWFLGTVLTSAKSP